MSTSDAKSAMTDVDAMHERLISAGETRDNLPTIDLEEISRIAFEEYRAAKTAANYQDSDGQGTSGVFLADAHVMRDRARANLSSGGFALREVMPPRRELFVADFLFAFGLPTIAAVAVAWLAANNSAAIAKTVFFVFVFTFSVATLVSAAAIFSGRRFGPAFLGRSRSLLIHSGGAVTAGLFVLSGWGFLTHQEQQQDLRRELESHLEKLNQAAVITLAGLRAGASVAETQNAVSKTTAVDWIRIQDLPSSAPGTVVARTDLPAHALNAEVQLSPIRQNEDETSLVTLVTSKSGEKKPYANYIFGTVVQANLDKVTIAVSAQDTRVLTLPPGTLPPPVNSKVVAAVSSEDGKVISLEPVDTLVSDLQHPSK